MGQEKLFFKLSVYDLRSIHSHLGAEVGMNTLKAVSFHLPSPSPDNSWHQIDI